MWPSPRGTNAAAIGDTSAFIDDVSALDAETDGAPTTRPSGPFPPSLSDHSDGRGIFTDEGERRPCHGGAARISIPAGAGAFLPGRPKRSCRRRPRWTATRILVSAAVLGYDQPTLNDLLQSAFRQSQEQAYSAWLDLTSAEEARALGVSDDHPVWQVQYGEDGVYRCATSPPTRSSSRSSSRWLYSSSWPAGSSSSCGP